MGVERVGRALDAVERVGDADLFAHLGQAVVDRGEPRVVVELGLHIGAAIHAAGGDRRVELERAPAHGDRRAVACRADRRVEPSLAEKAPRADHVADDVDRQGLGGSVHDITPKARLSADAHYVGAASAAQPRRRRGLRRPRVDHGFARHHVSVATPNKGVLSGWPSAEE